MKSALRSVGAVLAGLIVASVIIMIIEAINGRLLYPDLGKAVEGVTDREILRGVAAAAPVGSFLVVLFGTMLGSAVGGWVTARLAASAKLAHGIALGILVTCGGIANNLMIPPPTWFWIISIVVFIPAAYIGARAGAGRS